MKNEDFNYFIEEFENRVKTGIRSGYISECDLQVYRKHAISQVSTFSGDGVFYANDNRRVNSAGEYVNDSGEVIENESGGQADYCNEFTIEHYICDIEIQFNTIDPLSKKYDFKTMDIDSYLMLSLLCYEWGKYQYGLGQASAQSEGRDYLFKALSFINMWIGGSVVLMIYKLRDEKKQALVDAAKLGGETKSASYRPLKEKVVKLLLKQVPDDFWPTKTAAITSIMTDLSHFMEEKQRQVLSPDALSNLHRRIEDWSRNDPKIKAAFNQVVKKRSLIKK